jgi:regulator of sigma E protease
MTAVLLAAGGFMALIVLHELGHFAAAKAVGMRVERFSLFFPPLLLRKKVGETEYAIGALPLGGYVKISGMNPDERLPEEVRDRAYHAQPVWKRIVVIAAGPAVNLVLAFLLFMLFLWVIGPREITSDVGAVEPDLPAAASLQPGDEVIAVDGERGGPEEFATAIAAHECAEQPPTDGCEAATPATFTIERAGERREVEITPVYDAAFERTRVGFEYAEGPRDPYPFGEALDVSLDTFWTVTRETLKLPLYIIDPELREQITGVAGNFEITRLQIEDEVENGVRILAFISLALAIINLFPFLPLDGGHIFWAVVEKVRRKPVSLATMERAGLVGFMLVIALFLIGLTNDIGRFSDGGFDQFR